MAGETDGVEIVARRGQLMRGALTGWGCLMYVFLFVPVLLLVLLSFNSNRYGSFPITGLHDRVVLERPAELRPADRDQDLAARSPPR